MGGKSIWEIPNPGASISRELKEKFNITPLLDKVLCARGLSRGEELAFLFEPELSGLHDPYLMADMDRAVRRIRSALLAGEKIIVYGDYDVDGITSTYILTDYLRKTGANCGYYIPDRDSEGYGLNSSALKALADSGTTLVITVDSGVTAVDEAQLAAELGIDLVVTDHHEPGPSLPVCCAVVNPCRADCSYPFKGLAGVGVAFKLICALSGSVIEAFQDYGDMVALGTIADVMPLLDENRAIAKHGLALLSRTKNTGLSTLMRLCGATGYGADTVAFRVAPRLNAAGRMSSADRAIELLLSRSEAEAEVLASGLCELNSQRQAHESEIYKSAIEQISQSGDEFFENRIIVLRDESWRQGVVGIVASRLAERFGLPALLLTTPLDSAPGEDGGVLKGSGRSVPGFNLFDAVTHAARGIGSAGGHEMAAGVRLPAENFDEFKNRLFEYAQAALPYATPATKHAADCEVLVSELTIENVSDLARLEPYGTGNPCPSFVLRGATVDNIVSVGNGKHSRLTVSKDKTTITAMFFNRRPEDISVAPGFCADLLFAAEINEFRGLSSVRLTLRDIRRAHDELEAESSAISLYKDILAGNSKAATPPDRTVLALVWKTLQQLSGSKSLYQVYRRLCSLGYCGSREQMLISLRAFYECGLLTEFSFDGNDFDAQANISIAPGIKGRVDIYACDIMRTLSKTGDA